VCRGMREGDWDDSRGCGRCASDGLNGIVGEECRVSGNCRPTDAGVGVASWNTGRGSLPAIMVPDVCIIGCGIPDLGRSMVRGCCWTAPPAGKDRDRASSLAEHIRFRRDRTIKTATKAIAAQPTTKHTPSTIPFGEEPL